MASEENKRKRKRVSGSLSRWFMIGRQLVSDWSPGRWVGRWVGVGGWSAIVSAPSLEANQRRRFSIDTLQPPISIDNAASTVGVGWFFFVMFFFVFCCFFFRFHFAVRETTTTWKMAATLRPAYAGNEKKMFFFVFFFNKKSKAIASAVGEVGAAGRSMRNRLRPQWTPPNSRNTHTHTHTQIGSMKKKKKNERTKKKIVAKYFSKKKKE